MITSTAITSTIATSRKRWILQLNAAQFNETSNQRLHQQLHHQYDLHNVKCSTHSICNDSNRANLNKKYAYLKNKHESTWIDDLTHLQQWESSSTLIVEITCKLRSFCTLIDCRQYHQIFTYHFESKHQIKTSRQHTKPKHQSNNSFVYMKRLENSKNSCKISLHEKRTKKSHDISKSNANRHVKCQQPTWCVSTRMSCAFSLKSWSS